MITYSGFDEIFVLGVRVGMNVGLVKKILKSKQLTHKNRIEVYDNVNHAKIEYLIKEDVVEKIKISTWENIEIVDNLKKEKEFRGGGKITTIYTTDYNVITITKFCLTQEGYIIEIEEKSYDELFLGKWIGTNNKPIEENPFKVFLIITTIISCVVLVLSVLREALLMVCISSSFFTLCVSYSCFKYFFLLKKKKLYSYIQPYIQRKELKFKRDIGYLLNEEENIDYFLNGKRDKVSTILSEDRIIMNNTLKNTQVIKKILYKIIGSSAIMLCFFFLFIIIPPIIVESCFEPAIIDGEEIWLGALLTYIHGTIYFMSYGLAQMVNKNEGKEVYDNYRFPTFGCIATIIASSIAVFLIDAYDVGIRLFAISAFYIIWFLIWKIYKDGKKDGSIKKNIF